MQQNKKAEDKQGQDIDHDRNVYNTLPILLDDEEIKEVKDKMYI